MPGRKRIRRPKLSDGKVSVSMLNELIDSVERLDRIVSGAGFNGSIAAQSRPEPTNIRLVRMSEPIGPDESSEFRDRTGVVQYWNPGLYKWTDYDPEIELQVVSMPYGHFPVPTDTIVATYYHHQSGKHVVLNPPQIHHVRTVDPYTGQYPVGGNSKTYPVAYTVTAYENRLDEQELTEDELFEDENNRLAPSPPHGGKSDGTTTDEKYGYVFNLGDGYIPKGTVVHAWFYCGQLYTYYGGGGVIGRTQSEGISAMSGVTWPYALGSGMIDVAEISGDQNKELLNSNSEMRVYNSTHWTVPADTVVQIKYVNGVPFVDVDDCPNAS